MQNKVLNPAPRQVQRMAMASLFAGWFGLGLTGLWPALAPAATNSFLFNYGTRTALLADGWSFVALTPMNPIGSVPRNTETTSGAVVSYDQVAHPGVLRIPVDTGDIWATVNNSRNTLFRSLPTNWISARLSLSFWPTQAVQQANLLIYQDDDNYVAIAHAFNGSERVALDQELDAFPIAVAITPVTATNLNLRLDRDLNTDFVTARYSLDGTNWTTVGQVYQTLWNAQLGIFVGGSPSGFPNADLRRVDIITMDTPPPAVLTVQPQHLVFNATAGQPCTNLQQLRVVVRSQDSPVAWSVTNSASWLSADVSSGGTPGTCNAFVDTAGLLPGTYQGTLQFAATGSSSAGATVTLIVNPAGRVRPATWAGAKAGAMTVSVDDSYGVAFDDLSTNGLTGSYLIWDVNAIPGFFTNYYQAGMELGSHTFDHPCFPVNETAIRFEIESNLVNIFASTPATQAQLISFAWPCGVTSIAEEIVAADYFLSARGFNINKLEDPTPNDFMNLRSFNSHGYDPQPPADLKTQVDAAIAQGKWFNLVLHQTNDDNGAIAYSVGKDLWVAPLGTVSKYILQRDRTVITNYVESAGRITFNTYRLALDASSRRSFETAVFPADLLTFQVDVTGVAGVSRITLNGTQIGFTTKGVGGQTFAIFNAQVTGVSQAVVVQLTTNTAPTLPGQSNRNINELSTLSVTNSASDPDVAVQSLTYSLVNPPDAASIGTNGVITWTPTEDQGPGTYTLTTVVSDNGVPALSATNSFTVTVKEVNVAPTLPGQGDLTIYGPTLLVVTNTATDTDLPANSLSYQLSGPAGAAIDGNGVITWVPAMGQVPSTNLFTTIVTDTSPSAVNAQHLSATNTFTVTTLVPNFPVLPMLPNQTVFSGQSMVVTNTGSEGPTVIQWGTNTTLFNFTNRAAFLAGGWNFIAHPQAGGTRDTEVIGGAVVSYDQAAHPGILRIPCDMGDLWAGANNSQNNLFHSIPSNWASLQLDVLFAPVLDVQQAHLSLYQDDDNYFQVGVAYNSGLGGEATTIILETNANPIHSFISLGSVTNIHLRMDRGATSGTLTGLYSVDGINWTPIGSMSKSFASPQLGIWTGGSPVPWTNGLTTLDLRQLDVISSNTLATVLSYTLVNAPAGMTIDSSGVIRWTPTGAQAPSTNVVTTIVSDNAAPASSATNSFVVIVVPSAPVLPSQQDVTLNEGQTLTVTNTASSARVVSPYTTNTYFFTYPNRDVLLADGWSYTAKQLGGGARPTEVTNTSDPAIVSYDQGAHPGVLRIPCSTGDLWAGANNTINGLFRTLPTNWSSVRLDLTFAPNRNTQQAHLGIYQDDDNYLQLGLSYNSARGGVGLTADIETGGSPDAFASAATTASNMLLRLDRGASGGAVTLYYSSNGTSWTALVSTNKNFTNPKIAIWAGGSPFAFTNGMPVLDLRRLEVVTSNGVSATLTYSLVNGPTNAAVDANGIITWTPTEEQGPSTNFFTTIVADNGTPPLSATNSFRVVVNEVNLAPVLPVQTNVTIVGQQPLTVTNTASDADIPVNSLTYQLTAAPPTASIDAAGVITWTPNAGQVPSTNVFTTIVTDFNPLAINSQHLTATNTFTVFVERVHIGPVLPSQTNVSLPELSLLSVTNTATDSDTPALGLNYSLLNAPAWASIDTNGVIKFTPGEVDGPSSNLITTVVSDNWVPSKRATNSFAVVVNEINVAPTLPSQANVTLNGLQTLTVTNTASDADLPANSLSYQLTAASPVTAAIDSNGIITWTPSPAQVPGVYTITTVVTDFSPLAINSQRLSATNSFNVTVNPVHNGPSLPVQTNVTMAELTGLQVTNAGIDTDVPVLSLSYSLSNAPAWVTIDTNGVISLNPSEADGPSTNVITTVVTDNGSPQKSAANSFTVVVNEINTAPTLPSQSNVTLNGLQTLTVTNTAGDTDLPANSLSYQLTAASPATASIDANGIITWTPSAAQVPGVYTITTVVTDFSPLAINSQHLSATNSFNVTVNAVHNGPSLPVQTNVTMAELTSLQVTNAAIDTDVPALSLSYSLSNAPAWASISANGVISLNPGEADGPGTNVITTVVTDNGSPQKSAANSFTVVVNEINTAPTLPSQSNVALNGLQTLTVTNTAGDTDLPANGLSYQLTAASPATASIDANGIITWTPSAAQVPGVYTITTVVTDFSPLAINSQHLSATNSFNVTVNAVHNGPGLPVQTNVTMAELTSLQVTNAAIDTDVPALSLSYSLSNAPAWASISANGVISLNPGEVDGPGTNVITTVVTDNGSPQKSAANSFTVVVNEINTAPTLPSQSNVTLNGLQALTVTNTASDADQPANSLSYQLTAASPATATIDANGIITWTPSPAQVPGVYTITTVVTDFSPLAVNSQHLTATNSFNVTVNAVHNGPGLPVQTNVTMAELTSLQVTNAAIDTDVPALGLSYSLSNAPTWASIDGNGVISLNPGEADGPGTNVITTVVTDNGSPQKSAANSFMVVVSEINTAPVLPTQPQYDVVGTSPLVVTNAATDADIPSNSITYQLTLAPVGAVVDTHGVISWTPAATNVPGIYTFTTVATDFNPAAINEQHLTATNSFTVKVIASSGGPILPPQSTRLVPELTRLMVTNTAIDTDVPPSALAYSLVSPPLRAMIDNNGIITFTPEEFQGPGTNILMTVVAETTGLHRRATNSFTVIIQEVNVAPMLPVVGTRYVVGPQLFTLNNGAYDTDIPANPLTYQLLSAPPGAAITSKGVITWNVTPADIPSTNQFVTVVTDSNPQAINAQQLSTTNTFTLIAVPLGSLLQIESFRITNRVAVITWDSAVGQNYVLQYKDALDAADWIEVVPSITATDSLTTVTQPTAGSAQRFYRVRLGP